MTGGQPEPSGLACADSLKASKEHGMTTIVQQQHEVQVFVNLSGGITIKQECPVRGEQVVSFWRVHAEAICHAIQDAALEAEIDEIQGRDE